MFNQLKLFIILCLPLALNAQTLDYPLDKVSEHVYVIHGPLGMPNPENRGFMNNPAFIVADKGVIVVDPGSSNETGEMLLRKIKSVTDKPVTHIFNTHIHGDHWLANNRIKQDFPNVVIYADARMIEKAEAGEAESWIDLLMNMTDGATKGTKISYPNHALKNGDKLNIHGFEFRIHTVGVAHSDSDIMIELVEDSLMFTGDNVAYKRILRMDGGGFKDAIAACDRIIALNLKHYVPGHGKTGPVDIIRQQQTYFKILYQEIKKYYAEDLADYEMKPMIVKALSAYKDWSGFDGQVGKHISLGLLEVEAANF